MDKAGALLVGSPHQVQHSPKTHLTIAGQKIPLSPLIYNLGVKLDSSQTFDSQIKQLCKAKRHSITSRPLPNSHPYSD